VDCDAVAGAGERFRDRASDAAGRASDQNRSTAHAIMLAADASV
jgi:hypothetical protein